LWYLKFENIKHF
jgi:hypothetical protein